MGTVDQNDGVKGEGGGRGLDKCNFTSPKLTRKEQCCRIFSLYDRLKFEKKIDSFRSSTGATLKEKIWRNI